MLNADKHKRVTSALLTLNEMSKDEYMRIVGDVVEHSSWVPELAFARRPFLSVEDLNSKMMKCISEASNIDKINLFNRHPELAGREALTGEMTESSTGEQGRLGLTQLKPAQHMRLSRINNEYRSKFGFPFIVALRLHDDLESVMQAGEASLHNTIETEIIRTLKQISAIVHGRLCKIFPEH